MAELLTDDIERVRIFHLGLLDIQQVVEMVIDDIIVASGSLEYSLSGRCDIPEMVLKGVLKLFEPYEVDSLALGERNLCAVESGVVGIGQFKPVDLHGGPGGPFRPLPGTGDVVGA